MNITFESLLAVKHKADAEIMQRQKQDLLEEIATEIACSCLAGGDECEHIMHHWQERYSELSKDDWDWISDDVYQEIGR